MIDKSTVSIGALLVNARNQVALSQADIADQISLPRRTINALEKDNYEDLPESTYIRGYLRNYARAVGVDAENLVAVYNKQHHVESEITTRVSTKHSYDSTILWSTAAVLTILVGLLVNWWMDDRATSEQNIELVDTSNATSSTDEETKNITESSNSLSDTDSNTTQNIEQASNQTSSQDETQAINTSEVVSSDVEQAMEEESLSPNLVTLNDGSDVLTVTYVEKSWTEIRDADLNPLMEGLIEPGVVRNLSGKAPFYVFLGNSPGVVIEVNGQYFDQSQFNRRNRTARFQISDGSFN